MYLHVQPHDVCVDQNTNEMRGGGRGKRLLSPVFPKRDTDTMETLNEREEDWK